MIFRLCHGGIRENLSLVPVIREWREREQSDKLFVETTHPEIFDGNPDVTAVGSWFDENHVIDFDLLDDPKIGIHPIDLYAMAAFGDNRLMSRRMKVFCHSEINEDFSRVVCIGERFSQGHPQLRRAVCERFGQLCVIGYDANTIGDLVGRLNQCKLFIGCDEDITWLAMASQVPIVMLGGPRLPETCQPFREGVPFEVISWKCDKQDQCLKRNAQTGFGNVYRVSCQKTPGLSCENLVSEEDLMDAVNRIIGNKANTEGFH
jgi:hypothetical protein